MFNRKTIQMDLFHIPTPAPVKLTYSDLNIHQKINYKANQCGLCVVYKSLYHYAAATLLRPDSASLSARYEWHYKVSAGNANRLAAHRAPRQLSII